MHVNQITQNATRRPRAGFRAAVVFVLLVCAASIAASPAQAVTAPRPDAASFETAGAAKGKQPTVDASVQVSHTASLSTLQAKINWCRGAVFTKYGNYPGLIAEHDYCGGTWRLGRHDRGDVLRLTGPGVKDGLYVVTIKKTVPKGSSFGVLRGMGDVVLQTCYSRSLLLTGLRRISR